MAVCHIDFIPRMLQAEMPFSTLSLTGTLGGPRYETFSVVMQHVNEWLMNHPVAKPIHVEILEMDGMYGISEKIVGKDDGQAFPAFLKIIRLWYKRDKDSASKLAYVHLLPARLESTPRAFSPKFQNLEAMVETFNAKLRNREIILDGPLLSFQTGMFRFTAQNCGLDPERMFWMISSNLDDLHICFYFTLFFCPVDQSQCLHQIGFRDFAPTLTWKGQKQRMEAEGFQDVLGQMQKWISSNPLKVVNIQTIDHHAYFRCARDSSGYEQTSLGNPHFRSSFKGLMQFVKVLRLFHCTCQSCCFDKEGHEPSSGASAIIRQKSFLIERFISMSQINFSKSPLQLPNSLHTEYLSRVSHWITSSNVNLVAVETSKLCLADPRSSVSAESVVFQSSVKLKASAVYAIRLYVQLLQSSPSSLSCVDWNPEPRNVRIQPRSCAIL